MSNASKLTREALDDENDVNPQKRGEAKSNEFSSNETVRKHFLCVFSPEKRGPCSSDSSSKLV